MSASIQAIYWLTLIGCANIFGGRLYAQQFTTVRTDDGIEISEGGKKVLFYQIKPKSLNGKYERTNYVHPLYSLREVVLTEDFPEDHPHHRGIFWAWHQIIHNNKPIADGWTCENISWHVVNSDTQVKKDKIALRNEVLWKTAVNADNPLPVIRENSSIVVHGSQPEYRIIDFDIELIALLDNLEIGGSNDPKGYSGFSLRFKLPDDITFLTKDNEVKAQELAVSAGPWLDFFGSFEGRGIPESGVAVFCHPSNPGFPQPWILRASRSMQNPAYPGNIPVKLTRAGLHFRYRLVIHEKTVNALHLEKLYQEYASTRSSR
ncbi:MAG TPA: DUF6807 family protein [Chryseosolibacter sp.]|nr:DUF6807 family protein [Chryseosolibacter sp.]